MNMTAPGPAVKNSPPENAHRTIVDIVRRAAVETPDRIAFTYTSDGLTEQARITYGELDCRARALAARLQEYGDRGPAVLLFGPGLEFIWGMLGCLYAGVIAVPGMLARSGRAAERWKNLASACGAGLVLTRAADRPRLGVGPLDMPCLVIDEIDQAMAVEFARPEIRLEDAAYLQYTSGSTSEPKGVLISHANLMHNLAYIDSAFLHSPESVLVSWLPHFHDMGLVYGTFAPLYGGFRCVLMSPVVFLQRPSRWLEAISRHGGTHSGGPNFAFDLCVRRINAEERAGLDLRSWRVAFNGAEVVRKESLDAFAQAFETCGFRPSAFYPAYGLAECTLKVSCGAPAGALSFCAVDSSELQRNRVLAVSADDPGAHVFVGCGPAGDGMRVEIVDADTGRRCAPDELGEIWVTGPSVASGYWRLPKETAETFRNTLSDVPGVFFLRTGDLGFLRDGQLFIAGRRKDLVIVRGQNHYPEDIESTVRRAHPALLSSAGAAFSAEIAGQERLVVMTEIDRHYNGPAVQVFQAVRKAISEQHQIQAHAVVLLKRGTLPHTTSGKIQRSLCRTRFQNGELDAIAVDDLPLTSPIMEGGEDESGWTPAAPDGRSIRLIKTVAGILSVSPGELQHGRELTTLGLDSLRAEELADHLEREFQICLTSAELLGGFTIGDLLAREADPAAVRHVARIPAATPASRRRLPLTSEQQRLFLLQQRDPHSPAYNIMMGLRLKGPLDVPTLGRALQQVLMRHEALRTYFGGRPVQPVQLVSDSARIDLAVVEALIETGQDDCIRSLARAELNKPFRLSEAPLLRAVLLRITGSDHVLLLVAHHIVCDGQSIGLIATEALRLYAMLQAGNPAVLDEPALQFGDYAIWLNERLRNGPSDSDVAFWKRQLDRMPNPVRWPACSNAAAAEDASGTGANGIEFSVDLMEAVRRACDREHVTPFMWFLAVFKMAIHHATGQTDIAVGAPVSGRSWHQSSECVGFFAYPMIFRTLLNPDRSFRDLLKEVRETALGVYAHKDVPFATLVEIARRQRKPGGQPLLQCMLSVVQPPGSWPEIPGVAVAPVDLPGGAAGLELFLTIVDSGQQARGWLQYNPALLDSSLAARFAESFRDRLERSIAAPGLKVREFQERNDRPGVTARKDEYSVRIASTFRGELVEKPLRAWMKTLCLPGTITSLPYSQVFQHVLDGSLIHSNASGWNVILVRLEDWEDRARGSSGDELIVSALDATLREFCEALRSAAACSEVPFIVCVCPCSPAFVERGGRDRLEELERRFLAGLDSIADVFPVGSLELLKTYPVASYYDAYGDRNAQMPYTNAFFAALATMIARRIYACTRPPRKAIALDCDQTLWKGICGEDGLDGIEIDPPRRALQEFMVSQHAAGMLLCLCSKNNEADVTEVFDRRAGMVLTSGHIAARRINWEPKSQNLRSLASELNIGLDAFVLIDDNPAECAEVATNCPEVLTIPLPSNPESIAQFLRHLWALDHVKITEEDRRRPAAYLENAQREETRKRSLSLEDFLRSLDLRVSIDRAAAEDYERLSQLSWRTNQFNATMARRRAADFTIMSRSGFECLSVKASDRFGDYGIVGALAFRVSPDAILVDTFLLSCRALGKGIEGAMLERLMAAARTAAVSFVDIPFIETNKNVPALRFLREQRVWSTMPMPGGTMFRFQAGCWETVTTLSGVRASAS